MAGAGQPWYMPLTWPVGHVMSAITKPSDDKVTKPTATADLDLIGHLTSFAAALRSFLLALVCIYTVELAWSWMWPIIVRDVLATWIICGSWDWFLYFGPLKEKLHKYRFESKYPSHRQMARDLFVSTTASVCGAGVEIFLCYCWANGYLSFQRTISENYLASFLGAITITHLRVPHFWLIHRAMHPWRVQGLPDVGKFLYKHVHSLHHKSINTTAFSGTNMHPVEATAYYSAAIVPALLGAHPAIAVGCIIDCGMGAWLGHDGFQWPGSGDYFHNLHHLCFDCNFGAMHVPIDKWLGTFAASREDVRKIWRHDPDAGRPGPDGH